MRWITPIVLVLGLALFWGGCAGSPEPAPTGDDPPADFVLSVIVYPGPEEEGDEPLPRALRPGVFIIEADGQLRAARGEGAGPGVFPPPTRRISVQERGRLWRLLRDLEVLRDDHPDRLPRAAGYEPPGDRPVAQITVTAAGTRHALAVPLGRDDPDAVAAERLTDRLAELAGVRE